MGLRKSYLDINAKIKMEKRMDIVKEKCKMCEEYKSYLNEDGICIICLRGYIGPGTEIKEIRKRYNGVEIKSKTGNINTDGLNINFK